MLDNDSHNFIVAVATVLFFGGLAYEHLADNVPSWVRVVVGISAVVLAIVALIALL